jgi:AcrR family transcriptional regulator
VAERRSIELAPFPDEPLSPRARIREAMMDVVLANGYEATTVEMVVERAGVKHADFEGCFEGLEDCYVKVYEENTEEFERAIEAAFDTPGAWRDRLRAVAYATAWFMRDHPRDMAQVHRERQLQRMVDLIDLGRQELDDPESMSRHVAEGVVGSVYARVVKDLQSGVARPAEEVVPDLMYVAVRPYLGHKAAVEELEIPPPEGSEGG